MSNVVQCYEYETFAILVGSRGKRGYSLAVIQSPVGDVHAFCRLDPRVSPLQEMLSALENGQANEATLQQLGDLLFHALFTGDIASAYHASLSKVRGQNKQLRVRLIIEPPELATLPWEFLYDAQEDAFLGISSETAIVRYAPIPLSVHPTTITPPFRILVAVAAPHNVQPLDATHELTIVQAALAEWTTNGVVQLQCVNQATVAKVSDAMRQFRPHVFHFVGHGSFTQEQGCLLLENEDGSARSINERTFREFFVGCPDTRLVVLNACQTATTSVRQPLVGMAPRLLQRQLSAVVAMQYPIADTTSLIFTRAFYRALALGDPLEAAIAEARRSIYLEVGGQTLDWGTPVLFLRAEDGQLFQVNHTAPSQDSAKQRDTPTGPIALDGDFVRRDKIIQGDEVHGDQIAGNKTEVHIERVEPGAQVFIGDPQITQAPPLEIPPPPEPTRPPELSGFVGREAELVYYAEKLKTTGLAVICGMAGMGKTALASVLARQMAPSDQIFWHSFHAEEGFSSIIWQLAGFLARHGQNMLWEMLQRAQQAGSELPPYAMLLSYLLQLARRQKYLFCLDNFQFVDDDPLFVQLVEQLHGLWSTGELALIITSRRMPDFIQTTEFEALGGLNEKDMEHLLANRGLSLPASLLPDLYAQTEGNAQLLILAINALQHTSDPARLIARLIETDDVERYLMHQVVLGLSQDEKAVMETTAVLLGYPGTRDAIETISDSDNVPVALHNLHDRYLLTVTHSSLGEEYSQHATVQAFYYNLLGRHKREEMHHRAGAYYEKEEPNTLKAARHYQYANEYKRAAELATCDVWGMMNQGQARSLRYLLERFDAKQLDTILWVQVNLACGQIYALQGEGQLARSSYEEALAQLAQLPDTNRMHWLRVRTQRGIGELLQNQAPEEALTYLQHGQAELAKIDTSDSTIPYIDEAALLYILMGSVQIALGKYADAFAAVQQALTLLPEGPSQLRASALMNFGSIYSYQGNIEQALAYTSQALTISQQLHDYLQVLAAQHNLGIDQETLGDWPSAIASYQEALTLAQQLGSVNEETKIENSLGILYTKRGNDELAEKHLGHALELSRQYQLIENTLYILSSLACLRLRQGAWQAAEPLLHEAEAIALEIDVQFVLPEIYCGWAQFYIGMGDAQTALKYADQAVDLAKSLSLELERGKSLQVLGTVLFVTGQSERATKAFEESLSVLENCDRYEAARTKVAWSQMLIANGDMEHAKILRKEAYFAFQQVGATCDLSTPAGLV